jgi:PAS domain S-box-containing protein
MVTPAAMAVQAHPESAQCSNRVSTLEAMLQRHVSALDRALDGMAILEGDTYVYMNDEHARMYGYEREELIGKTWRSLYLSDQVKHIEENIFPLISANGHWRGEVTGLKKDGSACTVEVSLVLLEDGSLICACRDLAEYKRLAAELRDRNDELMAANHRLLASAKNKNHFLAAISHELRTPLHSILGGVELLQSSPAVLQEQERTEFLMLIEENANHLLSLMNDVLELAKVDAGKMELTLQPVSVQEIATAAARLVTSLAIGKKVLLETSLPQVLILINVDTQRFKQMLVNLLINAIKFTPVGGRVVLAAELDSATEEVVFSVVDNGPGLSTEQVRQLEEFSPFTQVSSGSLERTQGGSGLGLSLVKRLTDLHLGRFSIESKLGEGCTFRIAIPGYWSADGLVPNWMDLRGGAIRSHAHSVPDGPRPKGRVSDEYS